MMKFQCPHCSEKAIGGFSKFMSYEASPAVCASCKKFSCEPPGVRKYYNFISGIGFPAAMLVGLFSNFWWPLLAWLMFIAAFPFYALFKLPLVPVHELTVKKAKWQFYLASFAFITFVIWAGTNG